MSKRLRLKDSGNQGHFEWPQPGTQVKIAVTVIAPSRMERPPGLRVKTDRLDVGRMARQLEEGTLKGIYVPGRAEHERRQVVRTYGQAVKERTREQVRIRSLMQEHGRIGPAVVRHYPVGPRLPTIEIQDTLLLHVPGDSRSQRMAPSGANREFCRSAYTDQNKDPVVAEADR